MGNDAIGAQLRDRRVGIAEIDRDDGNAGGSGGVDIGARIADHDRVGELAADARDGLDQRRRIRLGDAISVLPADELKAVGDIEGAQQQMRGMLQLVGANGEPAASARRAVERGLDAGKQPAPRASE
jgi:hypothetical protein